MAAKKKTDPDHLKRLAGEISDHYGGNFPRFLENLKKIEPGVKVAESGGVTRFSMCGITTQTAIGDNTGKWIAAQNWANAARRALNAQD